MDSLFKTALLDKAVVQAIKAFSAVKSQSFVYGITGTQKSFLLSAAYHYSPRTTVVICHSNESMENLRSALAAFLPEVTVRELPAANIVTFTAAAKSLELAASRMAIFRRLLYKEKMIVLASAEAVSQKVMPVSEFLASSISIELGARLKREVLLNLLVSIGYERVDQVDGIGQFSIRGGIFDVFSINQSNPVRIELFDDEVDSLREFSVSTQRSQHNIARADILPITELEPSGKLVALFEYLAEDTTVIFDEPTKLKEQSHNLVKENPEIKHKIFSWQDLSVAAANNANIVYMSLLFKKPPYSNPEVSLGITARTVVPFYKQMDFFVAEVTALLEKKYKVIILVSNKDKAEGLLEKLQEEKIPAASLANINGFTEGIVNIGLGALNFGFELPEARLAVISEMDIFGRQKKKRILRPSKESRITYFGDINIGDYVVHINHGIGKYVGVETLEVAGIHRDYLHIRYAGDDKLYVPTDQVHFLQKYLGAEGAVPRLSRLGGSDWLKNKNKAKSAVADLAKDLIKLYEERQIAKGVAFEQDTSWQAEFEEAFPFEETVDQLTAISEIKTDMEAYRPMDRLLCGDAGFGKTEVAVRAAFKAVMGGKQVAVLVPTTVLVQQHFQTFSSRFNGFGPIVEVVSRFNSAREQRKVIKQLSEGRVDVLIGTHRILQPDVHFKDLGLLIVDEEQRFGVSQKEKLKKWSAGIDVLTLTATPIPRTLHMSLVGVRDMSIIETPPEDRFPVQTYVVEYNDEVILDEIKKELRRGGQVYFVYNRVQTIDRIYSQLSELLPEARIKVAHGQMPEELIEQVMLEFYEGRHNVLICTSIIENGLDVPNANTIIVYDADKFGLSQLYQMRGRVGRSHRLAFAYFTYRRDKILTEIAEKRLRAIKDFAELGSGFKIAMRDMEIRGVGNLLGAEQHGHIINVGFEMYCRLLDEAVAELRDGKVPEVLPEPFN